MVYDEFNQNVTNRDIYYNSNENFKITKNFTLVLKKAGNYIINVGGQRILKQSTSDSYVKIKSFFTRRNNTVVSTRTAGGDYEKKVQFDFFAFFLIFT